MQDIQENSRREYQARINRVMDYIDAHIAEPLDLSVLAAEAHFSQFHFHRLFVVMTGETPVGFLQRIRLEKAARYLQMNDGMPISEIAVCCGFSDASSFSRAFRRHFGMTASQMRGRPRAILIKEGVRYSKQGKMVSNNCQAATPLNSDLCPVELKNLIFMETKIEIKQMPDFRVIYVRHTGEFHGISKAYEKLSRWAGPRGLMKEGMKTMTVYHDDPAVTSIENLRQSACIVVDEDVKVEGDVGRMVVNGGKFAVGRFTIGIDGFEKAWNTMCNWLIDSGYEPSDGNHYELYHEERGQYPDITFVLDICIPLKAL